MKKTLSFFAVFMLLGTMTSNVWSQPDAPKSNPTSRPFISPSGHTLYYYGSSGGAYSGSFPLVKNNSYLSLSGNLIIPDTTFDNGATIVINELWNTDGYRLQGGIFASCAGLTSVTIPNTISTIPYSAFEDCIGLTSVNLPNSITHIGRHAFSGCASLTAIPNIDSVRILGEGAFANCYNLTSVVFDAELCTKAGGPGGSAFIGCNNISSFTFGENITSIPKFLFCGITNMTSFTFPANITSVGDSAFYNCTGLTEIHSPNSVAPLLGVGSFNGVPSDIPVYIPCGSSTSYYSRWSYFTNFIEEDGFTFTATSANDQQGTVQILTMPTCTSPQAVVYASANSGYHFDHWSDNSTSNPYSLTVTEDLNLVAYFAADGGGTEGIDDIDAAGIRIYIEAGRIVVEGTTDEVNVYDMKGRNIRNDNLPAGVYMVKVGNLPARKVVVMR